MCFGFFFFKQKTAYERRISDWSSDVCSSDLDGGRAARHRSVPRRAHCSANPRAAKRFGITVGRARAGAIEKQLHAETHAFIEQLRVGVLAPDQSANRRADHHR